MPLRVTISDTTPGEIVRVRGGYCAYNIVLAVDEPHLLFFDKKSMKILLEKVGFEQKLCSYYGETIEILSSGFKETNFFYEVRMKLLQMGVVFPFSTSKGDLQFLKEPLEHAMVAPFEAHMEQNKPSAWLRTIAIKQ